MALTREQTRSLSLWLLKTSAPDEKKERSRGGLLAVGGGLAAESLYKRGVGHAQVGWINRQGPSHGPPGSDLKSTSAGAVVDNLTRGEDPFFRLADPLKKNLEVEEILGGGLHSYQARPIEPDINGTINVKTTVAGPSSGADWRFMAHELGHAEHFQDLFDKNRLRTFKGMADMAGFAGFGLGRLAAPVAGLVGMSRAGTGSEKRDYALAAAAAAPGAFVLHPEYQANARAYRALKPSLRGEFLRKAALPSFGGYVLATAAPALGVLAAAKIRRHLNRDKGAQPATR